MNQKKVGIAKRNCIELLIVILLSFSVVFSFVYGIQTLFAGFCTVDDHEIAEISYQLQRQQLSVWSVIQKWNGFETSRGRLHPLYYAIRVLSVYFFGMNMTGHELARALMIMGAFIVLYYCGREMGNGCFSSAMFVLLTMMGYQGAIWWKTGCAESIGMLLMAGGMYLMLRWLKSGKYLTGIGSLICLTAMALYKESYVVSLLFFFCYVFYDRLKDCQSLKEAFEHLKMIKKDLWWLLYLVIFVFLIFILLVAGENSDGTEAADSIRGFVEMFIHSAKADIRWYCIFAILLGAVLLTYWDDLKKLWKEMLITMILIVPELVLHGGNMMERYFLPTSLGYSFFFVLVIGRWNRICGKRKAVYQLLLILLLVMNVRAMAVQADYYRYRANSFTKAMEVAKEMGENKQKVLSCYSPEEESNLMLKYWMQMESEGADYIYYAQEGTETFGQNFLYDWVDLKAGISDETPVVTIDDIDLILSFSRDDLKWKKEIGVEVDDFTMVKCGTMQLYVRKGKEQYLPEIQIAPSWYYG